MRELMGGAPFGGELEVAAINLRIVALGWIKLNQRNAADCRGVNSRRQLANAAKLR
jgi:hypothetical protein